MWFRFYEFLLWCPHGMVICCSDFWCFRQRWSKFFLMKVFPISFVGTINQIQCTCVLESDFGFSINCNFKKAGLFRVRNLGGVKAHFGLGKNCLKLLLLNFLLIIQIHKTHSSIAYVPCQSDYDLNFDTSCTNKRALSASPSPRELKMINWAVNFKKSVCRFVFMNLWISMRYSSHR